MKQCGKQATNATGHADTSLPRLSVRSNRRMGTAGLYCDYAMAWNEAPPQNPQLSLAKLIYTVGSATFLYQWFSWVGTAILWAPSMRNRWAVISQAYPVSVLVSFLMMISLLFAYRPLKPLVYRRLRAIEHKSGMLGNIALGLVTGLLLSFLSIPLVMNGLGGWQTQWLATVLADAKRMSPESVVVAGLLIVAVPISSEIVSKAIIFRTLEEHANIPAAVIGSGLLFAYLWPVCGWPIGILLGLSSAVLYHRTRSLSSSVIANAVLTFCAGNFGFMR